MKVFSYLLSVCKHFWQIRGHFIPTVWKFILTLIYVCVTQVNAHTTECDMCGKMLCIWLFLGSLFMIFTGKMKVCSWPCVDYAQCPWQQELFHYPQQIPLAWNCLCAVWKGKVSWLINPLTWGSQVTSDRLPAHQLMRLPSIYNGKWCRKASLTGAFTHLSICDTHLSEAKRHVCK